MQSTMFQERILTCHADSYLCIAVQVAMIQVQHSGQIPNSAGKIFLSFKSIHEYEAEALDTSIKTGIARILSIKTQKLFQIYKAT